ncbi:MAG: hypothetical protein DRJ64_06795 [Thermoprotei archaeon]|nr:MAG: hypothetical protein DRJ64_06795 [Thermoprotei archaeon]
MSENILIKIPMKVKLDCVPCLARQTLRTLRIMHLDESMQEKVLREVLKVLYTIDWDTSPPCIAHHVYRRIRELTGMDDPYRNIKRKSNEKALQIYPDAKRIIEKNSNKLLTAVKIAIAGNVMDFGALENPDIEKTLREVLEKDFAINDYDVFRKLVLESDSLLFFADNAGEIVFDKLLIETMNEIREKPFKKITLVVKGGPIINDATVEDVYHVSFKNIKGLEIRTVSNGDPNTGPERNSDIVRQWIKEHDLVIAKGQGNYEGMSEIKGLFFLLLVKCNVLASDLGVRIGDIILKYN